MGRRSITEPRGRAGRILFTVVSPAPGTMSCAKPFSEHNERAGQPGTSALAINSNTDNDIHLKGSTKP